MSGCNISGLRRAATAADVDSTVIFASGPLNTPFVNLLHSAFEMSPPPPPDPPAASPVVCAQSQPNSPIILSLEGLDANTSPSLDAGVATALSLSSIIAVFVRMSDLARPPASPIPHVMAALETNLSLRNTPVSPKGLKRRAFIVVVLDHDPEILPESRAKQLVSEQIDMAYADIRRPIEFSTVPFSQLYDLNTCLLPDRRHFAPLYATEEKQFRLLFGDAVRQYSMAMKPDVFINSADILSSYLTPNPADQLPAERELNDTFSCNAVMNAVLEKHRSTAKQWKATVDAGRVIRNFGTENDRLVEHTLLVYDKDAAACKSSKAFQRKRDELSTFLLSDSYALFAKQILKVRENAYQVFRAKLARIRINDQVEKNVRAAVKEAEAFFVEHAESLRSKLSNWRFDNERHELVNHMRDDATERLQLARLQGNYVPRMRSPIAFAFHTLLLAPFGRDSRFSHPHAEDMKQSYDPDKVKRAGLMRARPHQRGHNICVGGRDEVDDVFLEKFADLFGDVSDDK